MVSIRKAEKKDCAGIARIQVDSYRSAYSGYFPESYIAHFSYEEQERDWTAWLTDKPDDILLVAEISDGEIAGYLLARLEAGVFADYNAEIGALHVVKERQRMGIGRTLFRQAVGILQERGCDSVMLWTLRGNPVRCWYEALGGELLGEKEFQVEDWTIREVAYGWKSIAALEEALATSPSGEKLTRRQIYPSSES